MVVPHPSSYIDKSVYTRTLAHVPQLTHLVTDVIGTSGILRLGSMLLLGLLRFSGFPLLALPVPP